MRLLGWVSRVDTLITETLRYGINPITGNYTRHLRVVLILYKTLSVADTLYMRLYGGI